MGESSNEIARNSNIRSFERWLAGSPFTVENLSVERGLYFSGIIQTSKDKEEKKLMYLYVAIDIPIQVGDILTWQQDNGTIEKWLLLQKVHDVHEAYQTFQMVKCNYELKWIDTEGYLHKSWAYAVSSVDSKIKGNFRMWHSLISPQPNKFAEIIMPRPVLTAQDDINELMRGTTFIIENEGWIVIECDWTSVEGIVYMSLTESKVNYQYDDRNIDVADTDRYKFPQLDTVFQVGEPIVPKFEADTLNQWEVELIKPDDCTFINDDFIPTAPGQCIITMRLKNMPAVSKEIEIIVEDNLSHELFISGADEIKLDRDERYDLIDEATNSPIILDTDEYIEFTLENLTESKVQLATVFSVFDENKQPIRYATNIHANSKNKLGKILLTARHIKTVNNVEQVLAIYTKTIKIIPLW